jgi:hypothetical protein
LVYYNVDREGNERVHSDTYFSDGRKFKGVEHTKDLILTLMLYILAIMPVRCNGRKHCLSHRGSFQS